MTQYDFAIIGGGLGGLQCAYILASEGHSIIVLEKNHQLGGNLQVFSRDKCIFDTGVHYIGSLDEGQNLNKLFRYFGLLDKLKLRKMDESGFDHIVFKGDKIHYPYAQGYERFIETLSTLFPNERKAIEAYCAKMREICVNFPLYNLNDEGTSYVEADFLNINAHDYIASLTQNIKLRNVLGGNNQLYGGERGKTPLYVHALVVNSYIESAYRVADGGSHIAKHLAINIRKHGGKVQNRAEVTGADFDVDGNITALNLRNGEKIFAKKFISNLHPAVTIKIFGESHFRKAYVNRINALENGISSFTLHLVFKEKSFPYLNYNIYYYNTSSVWDGIDYSEEGWPQCFMASTPASSKRPDDADGMSVMTYMKFDEVKQWADSFNTIASPGKRDEGYEVFKRKKEEQILRELENVFPDVRSKIKARYSSTPLTFRDYIGNQDGSMYGIVKDCNSPLKTVINPKTKIPNLYLTGANINLHGILGVSMSSLVTCFEFIDKKHLLNKVRNA